MRLTSRNETWWKIKNWFCIANNKTLRKQFRKVNWEFDKIVTWHLDNGFKPVPVYKGHCFSLGPIVFKTKTLTYVSKFMYAAPITNLRLHALLKEIDFDNSSAVLQTKIRGRSATAVVIDEVCQREIGLDEIFEPIVVNKQLSEEEVEVLKNQLEDLYKGPQQ